MRTETGKWTDAMRADLLRRYLIFYHAMGEDAFYAAFDSIQPIVTAEVEGGAK